ncbi:DUF4395 domain-containing protein [Rathayibacter iranicus]|uniref:DUF4395 domain-containing protein n=2 Tax=Rathayibacter iranicus TaxID=59737 RepID=A0AAD1ELJ8_9MICO|nr:DUF4395 domain-containing protein [Rathayibacter iranicus]AZZ54735.1 DUF4395 domain-containing protein [Rathayibacter iranicus]MWV30526.1 DUF4395 family protein [Rathayibacter iranicus NCPPB 2253 = VKM Ac-1602]PPI50992.1 DUF4395 domain-containing protein [Rathayibacter iranicus]PPI62932.1 DUF4395 domain-containing protein [Rathayibacter iranicus]PPI74224.1 DUF4395 domain-containing protein [Rathayibacter iranicus]
MSTPPPPGSIDPRSPRVAAALTAALLLVSVGFGLAEPTEADLAARITQPGFLLLLLLALLFAWSAARGVGAGPWALLFRRAIRPYLAPPRDWEDARPPRFAQLIGLIVAGAGALLHLVGVPGAVPVAAAVAFLAAFLNAAVGLCLGCELYLVLARIGLLGRSGSSRA